MPHVLAPFYRGKRVLVVGHTGFVGGWLVAWLKILGAKVYGYALPPSSRPNFFDATLLDRGITSIFADIRDRDTLADAFADFQPEIIFHAAAHSGPSQDPLEVFGINVTGTLNVLEEARLTGSAHAIVLLRNSQVLRPAHGKQAQAPSNWLQSSHGAAAASALAFAETYFGNSRTSAAVACFPTLIGGGDWNDARLVPAILRNLMSGKAVPVHDGAPFVFLHVLESTRACLSLAEDIFESVPSVSRACEFTTDQNSISELAFAKKLVAYWGAEGTEIEVRKPQTKARRVSRSQGQPTPGWAPSFSIDQAIAWTTDWYKAYYTKPASAWAISEDQIQQYAKLPMAQPAVTAASKA